jgi:hypothetical protein
LYQDRSDYIGPQVYENQSDQDEQSFSEQACQDCLTKEAVLKLIHDKQTAEIMQEHEAKLQLL